MFEHPGELEFYLNLLAVKFAGFFVLSLRLQSRYACSRDMLHATSTTLVATFMDQAILLSLVALWPLLAGVAPDGSSHPTRGLFLFFLLLACLRYVGWLCILWLFFRAGFRSRPSKRYALMLTGTAFGLDIIGLIIAMATPAGRKVFFF